MILDKYQSRNTTMWEFLKLFYCVENQLFFDQFLCNYPVTVLWK
jgi:hypothetical protein